MYEALYEKAVVETIPRPKIRCAPKRETSPIDDAVAALMSHVYPQDEERACDTLFEVETGRGQKDGKSKVSGLKIVVSGATGFVGRSIVPILTERGADLLIVGRDVDRIKALFPNIRACSYDKIEQEAAGFDLFVHLAAVNNNVDVPSHTFADVNVTLALDAALKSRRARVGRFIYISSTHALDASNIGHYASSKREGARQLAETHGDYVVTAYLAAVHGERWSGKLGMLNHLPRALGRGLFGIIATLKPTLNVSRLAEFLLVNSGSATDSEIILSDRQQNNAAYQVVHRAVDLVFGFVVALLFWWLLLLIWVAIRLDSPGPGIFSQKRLGRDGAIFTCFKFRTMKLGTVQTSTDLISPQAVTRLGGFLRKTKLDELPQILNIFRNEISLVGPRPCLAVQEELIGARAARGVFSLKPGITGLAQVNGIDMSDPHKLALWDARYADLQGLILDIKIITSTALGRGSGDRLAQRPSSQTP